MGLNNLSQLNTISIFKMVDNLHENKTLINQMVELYNSIEPFEHTIPETDLNIYNFANFQYSESHVKFTQFFFQLLELSIDITKTNFSQKITRQTINNMLFSRFNVMKYMGYTDLLIFYFFNQLYSMQNSLLVTASVLFGVSGFLIVVFSFY